jgi:flagellar L-ring protein precursor FlgH
MKKILLAAAFLSGLELGCAKEPMGFNPNQQISQLPPPTEQLRRPSPQPGSLFTAQRGNYFTDMRARYVGDIITVEIVENSKAEKTNDSKASRTTTLRAGIPFLLGYENKLIPNNSQGNTSLLGADFESAFDAKAEMSKEDTMTAAIGCTVMEVLPNGNLIIRGQREIQVNGETQFIYLTGTVRAHDVTTKNTVMSHQLADARIEYTGRGTLSDKQQPGWLTRLLDSIWPF